MISAFGDAVELYAMEEEEENQEEQIKEKEIVEILTTE